MLLPVVLWIPAINHRLHPLLPVFSLNPFPLKVSGKTKVMQTIMKRRTNSSFAKSLCCPDLENEQPNAGGEKTACPDHSTFAAGSSVAVEALQCQAQLALYPHLRTGLRLRHGWCSPTLAASIPCCAGPTIVDFLATCPIAQHNVTLCLPCFPNGAAGIVCT